MMGFGIADALIWAVLALAATTAVATAPRHFSTVDGKLLWLLEAQGASDEAATAGATGANEAIPTSP